MLEGWSPLAPSVVCGGEGFNSASLRCMWRCLFIPCLRREVGGTGFPISEPEVRERSHPGGAFLPAAVLRGGFPLQDRTRSQVRIQQFFQTLSISDWPSEPVLPTWLLLSAEAPRPASSSRGLEQHARSGRTVRKQEAAIHARLHSPGRAGPRADRTWCW